MNQKNVNAILDNLDKPVSQIEADLGMPSGTLAKAKKGVRELPDKWDKPLTEYFFKIKPDKIWNGVPGAVKEKVKIEVNKTAQKENILPNSNLTKIRELNAKINKDFGEGTVIIWGEEKHEGYGIIPTGSLGLDIALGIGGLPRGRIVEIFGNESCGKTTLALCVIANAQKLGLRCLLIDAENAFDPEYAEALGIKTDDLEYCLPAFGEEGLEVADRKICSGDFGVVVIDSVAALVPKGELESQMGDSKMGLHARLMSQACRKMVGTIGKSNTLCIFINQIRHKIITQYWENPETTTGGKALQFYASVRLEVKRSTTKDNSVMNGDIKEGNLTTVKVVKNKCAPPFRQSQFNILYGVGIDRLSEIVDLGIEFKIITQSGAWFSYNDSKLGHGKPNVKEVLEANPEMANEIENKIKTFKP